MPPHPSPKSGHAQRATSAAILALAQQPAIWRYGHELCQQLDLEPGRLYRALMRLADLGLLEAVWESEAPADQPPRHRYRLSGTFKELLENAVSRVEAVDGRYAQVAGFRFSYDPAGQVQPGAALNVATIDFLARGGDQYPFGGEGRITTV